MSTLLAYVPVAGIWLARRAFRDGSRGWTSSGLHYWACLAWQVSWLRGTGLVRVVLVRDALTADMLKAQRPHAGSRTSRTLVP